MKLGVDAIRWALAAVNVLGCAILGYAGWTFYFGEPPKVRGQLVSAFEPYVVEGRGVPSAQSVVAYDGVASVLDGTGPPRPPGAEEKAEEVAAEETDEAEEGGPLEGKWEIEMTLPDRDDPSQCVAYLREKKATRSRFPIRSTRTFRRPSGRRTTGRTSITKGLGKSVLVFQGRTYELEDGKSLLVEKITCAEEKGVDLYYVYEGKRYVLRKEAEAGDPSVVEAEEEKDAGITEARSKIRRGSSEPPPFEKGAIRYAGEEAEAGGKAGAGAGAKAGAAGAKAAAASGAAPPPGGASARPRVTPGDREKLDEMMRRFGGHLTPEQRKKIEAMRRKGAPRGAAGHR